MITPVVSDATVCLITVAIIIVFFIGFACGMWRILKDCEPINKDKDELRF